MRIAPLLLGTFIAFLQIAARSAERLPGPLFDHIGNLNHPVNTASSRAQRYFNQGMRLLIGFNHKEAIRSFRSASHIDPSCAMAYWTRDRSPKPETEEILTALRFVMTRNPDHPGANHFYIHAVEAGPSPELGLPAADRLLRHAPAAGHLVHMPAHIYMRVGQYSDAILANERAVKADQQYIQHCRAQGFYPGVYYPHNIHFLWWAQLFEGQSNDALQTGIRVRLETL